MSDITVASSYTDRFRKAYKQSGRSVVEMAMVVGEVHAECGFAALVEWLHDEFGLSDGVARRLLRVHSNLIVTDKLSAEAIDAIAPSALYLLASDSTPDEVREQFVEQAKSGKKVTHQEVKAAVAATKPMPAYEPPAQTVAETITIDKDTGEVLDEPPMRMPSRYESHPKPPTRKGRGIELAHEAINVLKRIPVNDALRADGLALVARWIKDNK